MDVGRLVRTHVTSSELDPSGELVDGALRCAHDHADSRHQRRQRAAARGRQGAGRVSDLDRGRRAAQGCVCCRPLAHAQASRSSRILSRRSTPARSTGLRVCLARERQLTPARTLTNFYLAKLDDFDSLPPALDALLVLSKLPSFDDDTAVEVYREIVENVNMKAYAQSVRHQVYLLFDSFLTHHREALKKMGPDFIASFAKMVDGEKDPRNLMLLFQLDRVILLEFDVKAQIDEIFDITFCYFPITFRPPPNDPYGITADDLKLALRACMAASPYFAKAAIPLFLEKFVTAAGPTLRDLLLTMAACFPVYGKDAVGERGEELWEVLKTEVFYSSSSSIESAALTALEALVRTLYPTATDTPAGLAQVIIKQCLEGLKEPEKNQAAGSAKSLAAFIRASPSAGPFAYSQALPQLFRQFNNPALPSQRVPLLSAITTLLMAAKSVYAAPDAERRQEQECSLEPFREPLFDVLREGLRTDGLKAAAVRGSVSLAEIPGFWGRQEVEEIVQLMDDLLLNDRDEEIQRAVLDGLKTIAEKHADVVQSVTLPLLFHALPEQAPAESDYDGREKYRAILSSLAELCVLPSLFETLVVRIITKLDLLSSPGAGAEPTASERETTAAYAWDLLNTLRVVLDQKLAAKHADVARHYSQIVPRLFGLVVSAALPRTDSADPLFRDHRLLVVVASIAEALFWEQSEEKQSKIFETAHTSFESGDLRGIVFDAASAKTAAPRSPFRPGATAPEQDLIALYTALVRGLKSKTPLPFLSATDLLTSKIQWAVHVARDEFQLNIVLDLITAFVNKRAGDLGDALGPILERIWMEEIQDTAQPFETRRRGLLVYLHIAKALALLRNELAYAAVNRVIEILVLSNLDPVFVGEAARGFSVLADAGKPKGKGRANHLNVKLLYAQKLWSFVLPKLIEGEKEAEGTKRLVYLEAFASLLPLVPSTVLLSNLPTLLPLLLRSLSLPNPAQRTNVITTLTSILETANTSTATDTLLHEQAEALVDGFLKSALREDGVETSGAVRSAALLGLGVFPDSIRYETLRGAKARVVRSLGLALDDPLRAVRREAVDTRAKWYRYGA
ncbi:hypothetical protein VHUM_00676 [Vanrija humicola]|uniref:MMS19 nucleotide excision repair protein n=1 Tax=Vanrija humicola TaxID=5417 RepID=A0A7D8Z2H7_VANHU|nr:hypothetical protein VHUM_00676 [Vanrija humicola]